MLTLKGKVLVRWRHKGSTWSQWQPCLHNVESFGWVLEALQRTNIGRVMWIREDDGTVFQYKLNGPV